jgi:hypothetical protein
MKSTRLLLKTVVVLAGITGLFFALTSGAYASAEDQVDNGLAVAKGWVAQIDQAKYDESYAFGCEAMHQKVPQDNWEQVLKALRTPWGDVTDRTQLSHVYKPNGFEGASGEFLVITYDTTFKQMNNVKEVVVLKWEDGKWRGAGYNAGRKESDDNAVTMSNNSTTETHTDPHYKPTPQ